MRCIGRENVPFLIYDIPDGQANTWQAFDTDEEQARGGPAIAQAVIRVRKAPR